MPTFYILFHQHGGETSEIAIANSRKELDQAHVKYIQNKSRTFISEKDCLEIVKYRVGRMYDTSD